MAFRKKRQDPFQEIQNCLQKRDYKGAVDWFNALLQKDPKNTQIRLRFADTLVLTGSKRDAVKQYRIVADELAEKGFMIRAIAINKKILQLDPNQTDVHEKLAEMNEERSSAEKRSSSLAELLHRPEDPFRRSSPVMERPAPPAPPPSGPAPGLSLEESMAMEFGSDSELPEEPIAAPPSYESAGGGFELVVETEASVTPDEPPSFARETIDDAPPPSEEDIEIIAVDGSESEPEPVPSFDGIETSAAGSDDIVLEVDEEPVEIQSSQDEAFEISVEAAGLEPTMEPEIEAVPLELSSEPMAAESPESLLGALGEDIDSLIDSIISDVGSSAMGAGPSREPPPTHIPLFSDLTAQEFIAVAILLSRRVAKVGEQIVREGDPGDSMFIVSTGEVRATVLRGGQQVPVATLRDGDFFGEMAVLSGEPRTATVTAVKATELLELSREHLREIESRHPEVEAKIRLAYDERIARSPAR
jgi:hypothetical protein